MNINADREIFGYVKNLMRDCQFDDRIDIYFTCPSQDERAFLLKYALPADPLPAPLPNV